MFGLDFSTGREFFEATYATEKAAVEAVRERWVRVGGGPLGWVFMRDFMVFEATAQREDGSVITRWFVPDSDAYLMCVAALVADRAQSWREVWPGSVGWVGSDLTATSPVKFGDGFVSAYWDDRADELGIRFARDVDQMDCFTSDVLYTDCQQDSRRLDAVGLGRDVWPPLIDGSKRWRDFRKVAEEVPLVLLAHSVACARAVIVEMLPDLCGDLDWEVVG